MAVNVTRDLVTQYKVGVTGGTTPVNLHIRDVPDFIPIIGRQDEPMLAMIPAKGTHDRVELEWGQGDLTPARDQLAEADDGSETTLTVDNGSYFQKWDLIKVGSEVMLVTGISTNDLTVVRGWGSTTGEAHDDNTAVLILGPATPEGGISDESPIAQGETFINYSQIMEYTFEMTHRAKVTPTYEFKMNNRFKEELRRKMIEARRDLGRIALHGVKNLGDGVGGAAATNPSTTGGLLEFTSRTVIDLNDEPLTLTAFLDGAQTVYGIVGGKDEIAKVVMGSIGNKRIWNSLFPQEDKRYNQKDDRLKLTWDEVDTDFGVFKYFTHSEMRDEDGIVVWNPEDTRRSTYEGGNWATGTYATQGWFDKGFLRGDFGFVWQGDDRRFRFINLATPGAANYPSYV